MKVIRKEFPKIRIQKKHGKRVYTYYVLDCRQVDWLKTGNKKFEQFTTRDEAIERAQEIADLVAKTGKRAVIHDNEIQTYRDIHLRLSPYKISLIDVVSDWIQNRSQIITGSSMTVVDLADLWMNEKKNDKVNRVELKTVVEVEYTVKQLKSFFPSEKISEIDKSKILYVYGVWRERGVSFNTIRRNYGKMFKSFFRWCIIKDYIKINPCDNIPITREETEIKIYKVDEVETIFQRLRTEEKNIRMTPFYVLLIFCGLRPGSAEKMKWESINFKTKQITVPGGISKKKRTYYLPMHDHVIEWLKPWVGKTIHIAKNNRKRRESVTRELTQQQAIARHTAVSFWVHKYPEKRDQVLLWMNHDKDTEDDHYLQGVPQEEIDKFFNIYPNYTEDDIKKIQLL